MALTATATLNQDQIIRRIKRGGAREVARRADRLGNEMERVIAGMIDRELGPSSGRDAKRGMVPMREIDWQHRVENPGTLPVVCTLFSPDLDGPTGPKFGALNFGWKHYTGKQWLARTAKQVAGRFHLV